MPELVSQLKDGVLIAQFTSQEILSDVLIAQTGRELFELAVQSNGKMVVDFQSVTFMSTAMIGKIVLLKKKCDSDRMQLKLCNIAPSIEEIFAIFYQNRQRNYFSIFDSIDEALKAFEKPKWFD